RRAQACRAALESSAVLPGDSAEIERPFDDEARLDLRLQLGRIQGEERADLDPEGDRAVAPAGDRRAGLLEPTAEQVAHPLVHRGGRVGADGILERLEFAGP